MSESRHIPDTPRADICVIIDGDQLHCSRRRTEGTIPVDCQVNLPLLATDHEIRRAVWIWEAGFERGKEYGEWNQARQLRSILRVT